MPWLRAVGGVEGPDHFVEFFGAGLDAGVEASAGEFDGHDRGHPVTESRDGLGDADVILEFDGVIMGDAAGQGIDEAVGAENAEESSGEGGGDFFSDGFWAFGDGGHGIDDSEDGGDDADAWEGVADQLENMNGALSFRFFGGDFLVEEVADLFGFDASVDQWFETIAEEFAAFVVSKERGIFLEEGTFGGISDMIFEGDEAVATGEHKDLVEEF